MPGGGGGGTSIVALMAASANTTGRGFTTHGFTNPAFPGRSPSLPARGRHFGSRRIARIAQILDEATQLLPILPRPRPVFVDDTGRRGLLLGWLSVGIALAAVSMLVAFWVSQATPSGAVSPPTACVTATAGHCGVSAGA